MSYILNMVKEKVQNNVSVEVLASKYGKYPVVVTDKSESLTKGWAITYQGTKSKYNNSLYDARGRFSEITIANAGDILADLEVVYGKFKQGENVTEMYNTQAGTYQPNDKVWYTAIQRPKGVSVTLTVVDEASPFHMLQVNFFIMDNGDANRHPIIGFDTCFNGTTGTWTDKYNASLAPTKKRVIPTHKDGANAPTMVKIDGSPAGNGFVNVNENATEFIYVQDIANERRMVASIYEAVLMEVAFDYAKDNLPQANTASSASGSGSWGSFGQNSGGANWTSPGADALRSHEQTQESQPQDNQPQENQNQESPFAGKDSAFAGGNTQQDSNPLTASNGAEIDDSEPNF